MSFSEIEQLKNKIVEKELYFMQYKKDQLEDVMIDFKIENYSQQFLKDLEDGLKNHYK